MAGLQIPIGGDLAPFLAVAAELRKEMGTLAKSVTKAVSPARSETSKAVAGFRAMMQSTKGCSTTVRALGVAVGGTVMSLRMLHAAARGTFRVISNEARGALRVLSGFGSAIRGMIPGGALLGPVAGLASIAGSIALLVSSVKTGAVLAGDIEQTGIALQALTGSGDVAKKVLDEMRATWIRTGVTIEAQAGTIQKFLALGFSTSDAVKLQKNILDVAGAVGMSTEEAALLGSALAQVKAKGVVSMEELRQQIAEKGVPVFEALAAKIGVTQAALLQMVEDGKVPAQDLLDIFLNMEGSFGKFVGGANRMGMTFLGLINRLKAQWSLLLAEFAAPIVDSIKPMLLDSLAVLESFKAAARDAGKVVGDALLGAFALIKSGNTMELFKVGLRMAIASAMDLLMRGLETAVAFLVNTLPPIFDHIAYRLTDPLLWEGIGYKLSAIAKRFGADLAVAMPFGSVDKFNKAYLESYQMDRNSEESFRVWNHPRIAGSMTNVIAEALGKGLTAAGSEFTRPMSEGLRKATEEFQNLLGTVKSEMDGMRSSAAVPPMTGTVNPGSPLASPVAETLEAARKQIIDVTSLGRVGGGGFAGAAPMISEQKRGNSLLRQIVENTRRFSPARAIV